MLYVDFLNVGDGDAALIKERRAGQPDYITLVDTGRPHIEFVEGSLRREAVAHLMKAGVDHIDLMVLTHLHFDHIGGALRIMERIRVKRLLVNYMPPEGARWIIPPSFEVKTVVGLCESLNMLLDIVNRARKNGCECTLATAGISRLTDGLCMEVLPANAELLSRQKKVFDALYREEDPGYEKVYKASKDRNISSLITRFNYAGRSVLLTGDRYASNWEDGEQARCDILKLPHHGDEKSMTPELLERLAPRYAVISCQNTPSSKERPAVMVMDFLLRDVPYVLCTENHELPEYGASTHEIVRICVNENGDIEHYA